MNKLVKRIILGLLLVLIIAGLAVYFNLNRIVKRTVETQASSSLNLTTTLDSARLSLFGGSLSLDDLKIVSPQGYAAPHMMTLDGGDVDVSYGELRQDPVRIAELTLDQPTVVIEQAGGKFNFQTLMDLIPQPPPDQKPIKVVIGKLRVQNATVVLRPGLPGLDKEVTVKVPSMELNNVGQGEGAENGAAIKQVVLEVITSLAEKASASDLPGQLQAALKANAQQVAQQINRELKKKVGELAKPIDEALKGAGVQGVDEKVTTGLEGLLGGEKKEQEKAETEKKRPRDRKQ
jgi:uncharacterized protein involved in outer membrane biogenesis